MWRNKFLFVLGCLLNIQSSLSWMCNSDIDCASTEGALCVLGNCVCPVGQQLVLGGTRCVDASPYLSSACVEDHQCSRLITNFECRHTDDSEDGSCFCREGFHYLGGRCWESVGYGGPCHRDENCMGGLRDPFSLSCSTDGICLCAPGYYLRQRGECRRIASAVGEACVLDEDCQFQNGVCNVNIFSCYDSTIAQETSGSARQNLSTTDEDNLNTISGLDGVTNTKLANESLSQNGSSRQDGAACDAVSLCPTPFVCSSFESCICPNGYYPSENGATCYAELGSPSTEEQCVGLFSEVKDGICTCQPHFYFEDNMRDCVKVARFITDSCISDYMCQTFGVATRCSDPVEPWLLRNCECIAEQAVWDGARSMCRLFVGIGESCQVSSDCLAGDLEIECVVNAEGQGVCTCPEGTTEMNGLCLTTGLQLGDSCQASLECTETANTVCEAGRCSCDDGYQEVGDFCAPTIGGICAADSDCVIENTVCLIDEQTQTSTCGCAGTFVEYADECWPSLADSAGVCNVAAQCAGVMGDSSVCQNGTCACLDGFHQRDGSCWPQIGLFEGCTRSSECYLDDISDRVVCRNSICQCSFDYPYSEELHTCIYSAASTTVAGLATMISALYFILAH